jgi:hypothetical protein
MFQAPQTPAHLIPKQSGLQPCAICEHTMNPRLWKKIRHSRTKPVIAGDTTYGVSLLTATIHGSNFAIP